ncbi:MAG: FmdB family zinc ribbon protein [Mycobacteriales bacterium]
MPVYEFRCDTCGAVEELILALGDTASRTCSNCGATMRHRFSRVAVRYSAWGFRATDRLSRTPGRRDYPKLREMAERISDE